MKKSYIKPEVTVTMIVSEDIITLSGLSKPQTDFKTVGKTEIPF